MVKRKKNLRICLAASAGGHLKQLLKLSSCWVPYEVFYVSTMDVVKEKLKERGRVYITVECNHEHFFRSLLVLA